MYERRKSVRVPISLALSINMLFRQQEIHSEELGADIVVVNISKTGIGFVSSCDIPMGYYFNARITLGESRGEVLETIVKIVRKEDLNQLKLYGCEFVGLAPFLEQKIVEYQQKFKNENEFCNR
ncbi:MAG: PilZ domain-containing protein [Lachnospiraceae bacterium]|nr:PilZ domain-containing protein [Lachnospiraceae bacterium]MEE1341192.1 PilZ domain-containing protein [Lachnospiraceae bacterium]